MKEHNAQAVVDPAEVCECNPEWSSAPGSDDWDDCRCSVIDPVETQSASNEQKS